MSSSEQLVDKLVSELVPVQRASEPVRWAILWLLCSMAAVGLTVYATGAFRSTAGQQFVSEWRFTLEMLLGATAAVALAVAAFQAASPGRLHPRFLVFALGVSALWVAGFALGLVSPALEPSMHGKRDHCVYETFLMGLVPLGAALYAQRRQYALRPVRAALLAGLAAGILPALYMQVACMYEPLHVLKYHVLPGLLLAALAPCLLWALRRPCPRG